MHDIFGNQETSLLLGPRYWESPRQTEHSLLMSKVLANSLCKRRSPPEAPEVMALSPGAAVRSAERLPLTRFSLRSKRVTKAKEAPQREHLAKAAA